jgi:4-hydroxybenzoate polyprenyltransferase
MPPLVSLSTFKALFRLTRFWNLTIIALAQYFAAYFLLQANVFGDPYLLLLVTSTILIAAAGYVINDYYDIKIDLINKPERVVIGKGITRRYALFFHTILSVGGVAMGVFLDLKIGVVNFFSATLLWWYSNYLKRLPFVGNLSVALLTGVAILLVNVLYQSSNSFVFVYALFAFTMTLIREIIKDMEDWKGDNTFGCKTLPIIWGMRKTKQLLYVLLILFVLSVITINIFYVGLPVYYFIIFLFIPLGILLLRLIRADTRKDFENLSNLCKYILLLGILTMPLI